VQNTTQKRLSTMNMRPAIIEKPPSTKPAVAMKRQATMPTLRMVTTYTLRTMLKRRPSITPKSTVPSKFLKQ
jgi:hypothetical protein